jgi:hypothetical protein
MRHNYVKILYLELLASISIIGHGDMELSLAHLVGGGCEHTPSHTNMNATYWFEYNKKWIKRKHVLQFRSPEHITKFIHNSWIQVVNIHVNKLVRVRITLTYHYIQIIIHVAETMTCSFMRHINKKASFHYYIYVAKKFINTLQISGHAHILIHTKC